MSRSVINTGRSLAQKAKEHEEKEEWNKAIEAHEEAATFFLQMMDREQDAQNRDTLNKLKQSHLQKAADLRQNTLFDMKKLEKEINDIQQYTIEDDEDPFNKFWGVVEPMMDKLSDPIIMTSSNPIDYDTTNNEQETDRIQKEMSCISDSFFAKSTDTQISPKEENQELKAQVLALTNQIKELEKKSIDNNLLKSSIMQFKNDVHKQALRILQTQENAMMTRSATTTIGSKYGGISSSSNSRHLGQSTAEIVNRIRELEESNRLLRSQNRKQDALMNKYRDRWEKLKEGAKKRQPTNLL